MKPNWFIALPVATTTWFERIPSPPRAIALMHPDDLHATVAFLGSVEERAAHRAFDALELGLAPLDVTLGAVVAMGDPARYSALSALLDRGREEVERSMGAARERAWSAAGSPSDPRAPKAHVTLARPDRRASKQERDAGLSWASALVIEPVHIHVDQVALFTWSATRHDRAAPSFRVVRSSPLGG